MEKRLYKPMGLVLSGALAATLGLGIATLSSTPALAADASQSASATSDNGVQQVNVQLKGNKAEVDVTEVKAGPVTFNVTNVDSPAITEVELLYNQKIEGEKENLAPGLDTVSFTVTLDGGDYRIYTPGADSQYTDFKVTGQKAAAPQGSTQDILKQGVQEYADYVKEQIGYLKDTTAELNQAVQSGDVDAAKAAYVKARPYYERAESAVDKFLLPGSTDPEDNSTNLDYLIDMRESSYDDAAGWHGFHAVERDLWQAGEITDQTKAYAQELADNAAILNDDVVPSFADDLLPEDLANGAADLLEEVSTTKITGEEEEYSKIDLLDFRANVEGAQQAYASMRDGLLKIDPDQVAQIDDEFQKVDDLLDSYRDDTVLGGYKLYTDDLKASDSEKMAQLILPLHEDLASLAEKVATA